VKSIGHMSVGELAAFICSHLRKYDIDVVLSGGSCVSIYSNNKYVSSDLDFVDNRFNRGKKVRDALSDIGFYEENRYFKNPETDLLIEFPPGPLSVGDEPVKEVILLRFSTGELRIISPTDCVKDRLAAYYHWDDRQGLEQAVLVARDNEVNLGEIERWSSHEGKLHQFHEFRRLLRKGKI
jgi:hypothetical protein